MKTSCLSPYAKASFFWFKKRKLIGAFCEIKKNKFSEIFIFWEFFASFLKKLKRNKENYEHMVKLFGKRKTQSSEV
jgi:hypothetical protein